MRYTPGPWELHAEFDGGNGLRVCKSAHNERGCIGIGEAEILGMPRKQAEANARLIAAAPELLEILSKVASVVDPERGTYVRSVILEHLHSEVTAAIAKATS